MAARSIKRIIPARPASDGAGVRINRVVPPEGMAGLDPFLMLDELNSADESDFAAGFPSHPHRGFETVSYMRTGSFRHEDHMGNSGKVDSGGAQWMTAGRGVIHSEFPEPEDGRMHGFQLWLNLPAERKMMDPAYRDVQSTEIPSVERDGVTARVVAGTMKAHGQSTEGPVHRERTEPLYLDLLLEAGGRIELEIPSTHRVFVYVYDGELTIGGQDVRQRQMAELGTGEMVAMESPDGAGALLLAGRPLNEPVVHYGPFVMNTQQQIHQAINDYRAGRLA